MTQRRLLRASDHHVPTYMPTGWSSCCWSSSFLSLMSCCSTCSLPCSGQGLASHKVMFVRQMKEVALTASLLFLLSNDANWFFSVYFCCGSSQLHLSGSAGKHRHLLEVPEIQPDCGVPQPSSIGPTLHHHQPSVSAVPQPSQATWVQAGASWYEAYMCIFQHIFLGNIKQSCFASSRYWHFFLWILWLNQYEMKRPERKTVCALRHLHNP